LASFTILSGTCPRRLTTKRSSKFLERAITAEFYKSRTLNKRYSGFFETIFLISRFAKLFSVKSRGKQEKGYNEHSFDVSAVFNGVADVANK